MTFTPLTATLDLIPPLPQHLSNFMSIVCKCKQIVVCTAWIVSLVLSYLGLEICPVVGTGSVCNCSVLAAVHTVRKSHVSVLPTSLAIVSIFPICKVLMGARVATILAEHDGGWFCCCYCVKNGTNGYE